MKDDWGKPKPPPESDQAILDRHLAQALAGYEITISDELAKLIKVDWRRGERWTT